MLDSPLVNSVHCSKIKQQLSNFDRLSSNDSIKGSAVFSLISEKKHIPFTGMCFSKKLIFSCCKLNLSCCKLLFFFLTDCDIPSLAEGKEQYGHAK